MRAETSIVRGSCDDPVTVPKAVVVTVVLGAANCGVFKALNASPRSCRVMYSRRLIRLLSPRSATLKPGARTPARVAALPQGYLQNAGVAELRALAKALGGGFPDDVLNSILETDGGHSYLSRLTIASMMTSQPDFSHPYQSTFGASSGDCM